MASLLDMGMGSSQRQEQGVLGGKQAMFRNIGLGIPTKPAQIAPESLSPSFTQQRGTIMPKQIEKPSKYATELLEPEQDMKDVKRTNKEILFESESSGNYQAENKFGYLGGYQLGDAALTDLGYVNPRPKGVSQKEWLNNPKAWKGKDGITSKEAYLGNPKVQDEAFANYQHTLWKQLKSKGATKFIGETVGGVYITREGLLRSAHLLGAGGISKALKNGDLASAQDAFGTSAKDYMEKI